jgi:flagellar L-ring protein precursor FlgH
MLGLAACASVPDTHVHQPMSARPVLNTQPIPANGAIYNVANSRPLFEDRRARFVGDTLTINIVEKTTASQKNDSKSSRDTSMSASVPTPTILGYTPATLPIGVPGLRGGASWDTSVANMSGTFSHEGKGEASQNNAFTGTITVTVIETYPNGNLLVSGEKMMGTNEGNQWVRFSGVVNPTNITSSNTVSSTQVADARVEFKGNSTVDTSQMMGWLAKFFLTIMPF